MLRTSSFSRPTFRADGNQRREGVALIAQGVLTSPTSSSLATSVSSQLSGPDPVSRTVRHSLENLRLSRSWRRGWIHGAPSAFGLGLTASRPCGSVSVMRRLVAALSLVLVIVGAAWCVDGCEDPSEVASSSSPAGAVCTICVVPFAVTPQFKLPPDSVPIAAEAVVLVANVISVPPLGIDHPPRLA